MGAPVEGNSGSNGGGGMALGVDAGTSADMNLNPFGAGDAVFVPVSGEHCNGADDDGDGVVDEELLPPPTENQAGDCLGRTQICNPSRGWVHDDQGPGLSDIRCDGRDDDCDGAADEGFVQQVTQCGAEQCPAMGTLRCLDGIEIDSCIEGDISPVENPCDGADNDCDGVTDEVSGPGECCRPGDEGPPCNGCPESVFVPEGWVCVPAGQFEMGSPDGRYTEFHPEQPVHQVTISRSFLAMATEITQAQWTARLEGNPATYGRGQPNYPVNNLNWYEALVYANALSAAHGLPACYRLDQCSGLLGEGGEEYRCRVHTFAGVDCPGYRLPTEAEWEYMARAGHQSAFAHSDSHRDLEDYAWFAGSSGARGTRAVGQLTPNPWGLYDLHGNAFEWVQDLYRVYAPGPRVDPVHDEGDQRVLRGGCYQSVWYYTRSALRYSWLPYVRDDRPSARLVRTLSMGPVE